ncbi:uncharacterized protein YdhG (YjbR/CyaY superfamily) [Hamadaea flava]|uniref:Iron chaperone n=1 Tax=Hamadaea flava TaxID=1742688 RepID=A0ABV8LMD8_9ACTN|nr:DUF1801 domain-containing protein [Hamadaea flava]MCP2329717.1 uncharacterized protein YdhG (YjbR/CyaY superfamily) [Hamadaea flava]
MATAKKATKADKSYDGFNAEERAAMKEHAKEMKAAKAGADAEAEVLAKIAEMEGTDRAMAEKIHAIVKKHAPELAPQTWYGQPAYKKDGKVVCFFQAKAKFKTRYATFGFQEAAQLDEGGMWPTSYALTKLTAADEKRIAELVKKAAGTA